MLQGLWDAAGLVMTLANALGGTVGYTPQGKDEVDRARREFTEIKARMNKLVPTAAAGGPKKSDDAANHSH